MWAGVYGCMRAEKKKNVETYSKKKPRFYTGFLLLRFNVCFTRCTTGTFHKGKAFYRPPFPFLIHPMNDTIRKSLM